MRDKKSFLILLVVMSFLAVVAGCGKKGDEDVPSASPSANKQNSPSGATGMMQDQTPPMKPTRPVK